MGLVGAGAEHLGDAAPGGAVCTGVGYGLGKAAFCLVDQRGEQSDRLHVVAEVAVPAVRRELLQVALVDDHELLRKGIRALLETLPGMERAVALELCLSEKSVRNYFCPDSDLDGC